MNRFSIFLIQAVSNFFRAMGWRACRFYPTCSHYASEAFQTYRFDKAFVLTAKRICSCHPFTPGGYDPLVKEG